ncbi:hypothetical protein ACQ4LE_002209 [Meloidogyne hapla]|uniref:H15 domain-containing protein n=1 Tax=Meloidogyne hapla TaxID=6305 RepID=A0A1I8BSM7_MELHA
MSTVAASSPTSVFVQQGAKKSIASKKTKTKSPKTSKKPNAPSDHPPYKLMIKKALSELKQKKGTSRLAILKFIMSNFNLGENTAKINSHLKMALKKGVQTGYLKQIKGIGAGGSFVLGDGKIDETSLKPAVPTKAKKAKSPAKAAGVKKPSVKKAAPKKKTSAKKVVPAKVSPAAVKPAPVAATPVVAVSTPPAAKKVVKPKKAKSAKKAKSPKKLNVAKKSPIKKASARTINAKKPKASGGKKPVKKAAAVST